MNKIAKFTIPYIVWCVLMIVIPMLLIVFYSFTKDGNGILSVSFTLEHYKQFFSDKDFLLVLANSLIIAVETTAICIVIGYPVAYFISKASAKKQSLLIILITLPMWINMLVRTYAWIGMLSKGGIMQSLLGVFGFEEVELLYTRFAVILGMVYNFLPFMIIQVHSSLSKMDNSLLEAGADLGASPKQSFLKITLPLSMPGVVSGISLVFLPCISSFFIPKLLGGGKYLMIGNVIENEFINVGQWSFGSSIAVIIAIIMMLSIYLVRNLENRNS